MYELRDMHVGVTYHIWLGQKMVGLVFDVSLGVIQCTI